MRHFSIIIKRTIPIQVVFILVTLLYCIYTGRIIYVPNELRLPILFLASIFISFVLYSEIANLYQNQTEYMELNNPYLKIKKEIDDKYNILNKAIDEEIVGLSDLPSEIALKVQEKLYVQKERLILSKQDELAHSVENLAILPPKKSNIFQWD